MVTSSSSSSTTARPIPSWSALRRIPNSRAGRRVRTRCSRRSSARRWTTRRQSGFRWSSTPTSARARSRQAPPSASKSRPPVADHEFDTVASETLYVGKIFALRADEVRMPGGGTARREIVEHYGAVGIVALDDDRNVVMVHQYRHPVKRRLWELPAGLLDMGDEPAHETAARELMEEAGLAAGTWRVLVDVISAAGFSDE